MSEPFTMTVTYKEQEGAADVWVAVICDVEGGHVASARGVDQAATVRGALDCYKIAMELRARPAVLED